MSKCLLAFSVREGQILVEERLNRGHNWLICNKASAGLKSGPAAAQGTRLNPIREWRRRRHAIYRIQKRRLPRRMFDIYKVNCARGNKQVAVSVFTLHLTVQISLPILVIMSDNKDEVVPEGWEKRMSRSTGERDFYFGRERRFCEAWDSRARSSWNLVRTMTSGPEVPDA